MLKSIAKTGWELTRIAAADVQRRYLGQYIPARPRTINLLANDICNSRCTMCNIWQQKRDKELTPDDLRRVLSDRLFEKVRHVGITGGEPTLRSDLPDLFDAVCTTLPAIRSAGLITNAIRTEEVIDRTIRSADICTAHGVTFNAMVSLDGVDDIHDLVRGKPGNFKAALEVIDAFEQNDRIDLSIGCTVTKQNVWHVDGLLEFCQSQNWYVRFRVAEFIARLYNEDAKDTIRSFDDAERYHLATFFKKLELTYETSDRVRRTYRSIAGMLLGERRKTACPYQARDVVLDCRGNIQYCAPKSKTIGQTLTASPSKLFRAGLPERRRILREHCDDCIHDYHADITLRETFHELGERFWRRMIRIDRLHRIQQMPFLPLPESTSDEHHEPSTGKNVPPKHVFITGWYGTETVGDKAILGGLIQDYRERFPDVKITVSSLHPLVTRQTIRELNVPRVDVVPVYSARFLRTAAFACETVMGGGPLMDIEALAVPLSAFTVAKRLGKRTVIRACGIGPLNKARYIDAVKELVALADATTVRDDASADRLRDITAKKVTVEPDPAIDYIRTFPTASSERDKKPVLACFLREWTRHYAANLSKHEFHHRREIFERYLARYIRSVCKKHDLQPVFYPMHTFVVGNDDRAFNRRFVREYLADTNAVVSAKCSSVRSMVTAMREATTCLCMRYHSVVFAHTLGADFAAIDYTNGGKIAAFLEGVDESLKGITIDDVIGGRTEQWQSRCQITIATKSLELAFNREVAA